MKQIYDKKYYTTGNYINYLSKRERYEKLAEEIADILKKLSFFDENISILDYGCALGFLLDGFSKVGIQDTYGFDISDWAISQVKSQHKILSLDEEYSFDLITMLDVLEHMTDEEIKLAFEKLQTKMLIVRIPVSSDGGKTFHLEVSRADPTHINCKEKGKWIEKLNEFGYNKVFELNLSSIYSTKGVFCAIFMNSAEII